MADYGSNLIVNPSAIQPLVEGWAANNVTVIDEGSGVLYYRIGALGYMQQNILTTIFGTSTNTVKLSIRVRFINSGIPIYTDILLFMQLSVTNTDKATDTEPATDNTILYTLPCQTMISTGDSGWFLFEGEFDVTQTNISAVILNVYTVQTDVIIDVDSIAVMQATKASTEEQIRDDAATYTDINLEKHLEDMDNSHLSDEQKAGLTGKTPRLKTIKLGLENDIHNANSKLYNGNVPLVSVDITRKSKPITTPLYWQEAIVQVVPNVTCTSIAIQQDGPAIKKVYIAFIANKTLTVVSAPFSYPIGDMIWTIEATIENCLTCAIEFDGNFKDIKGHVEFYTDNIPWVFYTTPLGAVFAGILNTTYIPITSSGATAIDAIRGFASSTKDIDQGMIVFYIANSILYYQQCIANNWSGQQEIAIAPDNLKTVHAERVFDYRICLHLTTLTGELYEVFTKMMASGWNGFEYLTAAITSINISTTEIAYLDFQAVEHLSAVVTPIVEPLYTESPVMLFAENYARPDGDYGYMLRLKFDERVRNTFGTESSFTITDFYGTVFYGAVITENYNELLIEFSNLNNASNPVTVAYTPGTATGDIVPLVADSLIINLVGLVPYYSPPPIPLLVYNDGAKRVNITFDKPVISSNWDTTRNGFRVTAQEYDMIAPGTASLKTYEILTAKNLTEVNTVTMPIADAALTDTIISGNVITLMPNV